MMQYYTEPISRLIEEFSKLPGVGKKTAQRLILELKDKLKSEDITCGETEVEECKNNCAINNDAIVALQVLGYCKKEAETALEKIDTQNLSVEETIKHALKYLSK